MDGSIMSLATEQELREDLAAALYCGPLWMARKRCQPFQRRGLSVGSNFC